MKLKKAMKQTWVHGKPKEHAIQNYEAVLIETMSKQSSLVEKNTKDKKTTFFHRILKVSLWDIFVSYCGAAGCRIKIPSLLLLRFLYILCIQ